MTDRHDTHGAPPGAGDAPEDARAAVAITGSTGAIGLALVEALEADYRIVGLDRSSEGARSETIDCDLADEASVTRALEALEARVGPRLAAVVHLAAYYDFTGEPSPLYDEVNVAGTRRLVLGLRRLEVERFVYTSTMLVHRAAEPGGRIDEDTPIEPGWAYPESKARAEAEINEHADDMPVAILRLAGLYDGESAVPTLSQQIARIYERDVKSRVYAGGTEAGQSMIHADDVTDLVARAIARRQALPQRVAILAGEPDPMSYGELQDRIGERIHGAETWTTLTVPAPLAKAGAFAELKAEPVVPDAFDRGEKPFVRPFMIEMAADHYALDVSRAKELLGWTPRHDLRDGLDALIESLERDPLGWYERNGVTPPLWLEGAAERDLDPEALRARHEARRLDDHRRGRWAHLLVAALGTWLLVSPATLGLEDPRVVASDLVSGALLVAFGLLSLSASLGWARLASAVVGFWLLWAPLVFLTPSAAAYLNDTLVGALAIGLALGVPPMPGVSPLAAMSGPRTPAGWSFNPSSWLQRMPIIVLAFVGLYFSRYLAAYQLEQVDGVWEPFFEGDPKDPKNGTEEIVTSAVSEAWPVPDAGVGAVTYVLEIITGVVGGVARWRTVPWLVLLFGIMIVPLGVVSVGFIIIQPIVIGTWSTLALIGAAAMLVQIPYSFDELVACCQFLWRRKKAGRPILRVLVFGDTDEGEDGAGEGGRGEFDQAPGAAVKDMLTGGVTLPWHLAGCLLIGLWLLFTRLTLGAEGTIANVDHVVGALALTVTVTATAEVARTLRLLNVPLGITLAAAPFVVDGATGLQTAAMVVAGLALVALALPRGTIHNRYGGLERYIL